VKEFEECMCWMEEEIQKSDGTKMYLLNRVKVLKEFIQKCGNYVCLQKYKVVSYRNNYIHRPGGTTHSNCKAAPPPRDTINTAHAPPPYVRKK